MEPVDVLRNTRELLAKEDQWIQYAEARDALDNDTNAGDSNAVCWCLLAGIYVASGMDQVLFDDAVKLLIIPVGFDDGADWNDMLGRTHVEVLELLDQNIAWLTH